MPYDASQGGGTRFQQMRARRAAVPSPAVQPGGIGSRGVASGPGGTIYGGGPQVQPGGIGQRMTPSGPGGYINPGIGAVSGPAINAPRSGPGGYLQPQMGMGGGGGWMQRSGPGGYIQPQPGNQQMRPYMDPFAGGGQNPQMAQIQSAAQMTAQQQMEEQRRRQMLQRQVEVAGGPSGFIPYPGGGQMPGIVAGGPPSGFVPGQGAWNPNIAQQTPPGFVPGYGYRGPTQLTVPQAPNQFIPRPQQQATMNPYGNNFDPYSQNR